MEKLSLPVEEFTTPNPITAPETTSVDELNRIMNEYGIRHIPITKKRESCWDCERSRFASCRRHEHQR